MKKLISWLCTAAMLMQLIVALPLPQVHAAENATVEVSSTVAKPGDTNVEVDVTVTNNPGICGMLLHFDYDPALTLVDVQQGEAMSSLTLGEFAKPYLNPLNATWDGATADNTNGTVLKLFFDIPEGTLQGKYMIDVYYTTGNVYDNNLNDLELNLIPGTITVYAEDVHTHTGGTATCNAQAVCGQCGESYGEKNPDNHAGGTEVRNARPATATENGYTGDTFCLGCGKVIQQGTVIPATGGTTTEATVKISSVTVLAGDTEQVHIVAENMPQAVSMLFLDFSYDTDALELLNAEFVIQDAVLSDWSDNIATIAFAEPVDINGNIMTLTFKATENVEGVFPVSCQSIVTGIENGAEAPLDHTFIPGQITIRIYQRGDVNGDEVVDRKDAIHLLRYTMLPSRFPINQSGDMNGDGVVDRKDAIHLLRHTMLPSRFPLA